MPETLTALPMGRSSLFDPPEELRDAPALCPVEHPGGGRGWLVTSYSLARSILTDPRFGRGDFAATPRDEAAPLSEFEQALEPYGGWRPMQGFNQMDPPHHTRIRRFLSPYFSVRRLEELRPEVERLVEDRLDAISLAGAPADLVGDYAAPISLGSQCALLGIPASEAARFFRLGSSMFDPTMSARDVVAAWRDAWEYMRELTKQKRQEPAGDVLSDVGRHGELSDDEVADTALVLFQGGLETTGDMLALAAFILLCSPDQLGDLRTGTETAVEELLRYAAIFRFTFRNALEDVDVDGTVVRSGDSVAISLAAANRDPERFEDPDRLDLRRAATGHLAFAQGIHMCIGQHLARIELQVALPRLFERFSDLRLAVPAEDVPVFGPGYMNFGVSALPVTWTEESNGLHA